MRAEEIPVASPGRWPLRIAALVACAFVGGPAAAHFGWIPPFAGFLTFAAAGIVGLLNAVGGLWTLRRGARGRGILVLLLSEIPGMLLVYGAVSGRGKPVINDITTDTSEPPPFVQAQTFPENRGRDLGYPEPFKSVVRTAYPELKTLHLAEPPDPLFARAVRLAQRSPDWEVTYVNGGSRTFEGVATSDLFRFRDDFVVRVRPDGPGSLVDMRSKSRDGQGDFGVNAERIRRFFTELQIGRSGS
jgi:hypothetical protein